MLTLGADGTNRTNEKNIVFDTGPEFRIQMLRAKVKTLEHVIYTHTHSDHCHGFDDLRAFYFHTQKPVTCHIHSSHANELRRRFEYAFTKTTYLGTKPHVDLVEFEHRPFSILGLEFEPFLAQHGDDQTSVFRVGNFAYATDFKYLSGETIKKWRGKIDTMVASGLRFGEHKTHSCIEETIALFKDLEVRRGFITHMGHEVDYPKHRRLMPKGVALAYDNLKIKMNRTK